MAGRTHALRPGQRLLRGDARCAHDLHLRLLGRLRHPGRSTSAQAGPGLPQARAPAWHARAGHRLRMGQLHAVRGQALRRAVHRRHHLGGAGRLRARTVRRPADRDPAGGLPRPRRPLRPHREPRHVRARGPQEPRGLHARGRALPGRRRPVPAAHHRAQRERARHRSVDRPLHLPQRRAAHPRRHRARLRRPLRGRRPAQLRRRLRPHADGLARELRGRMAGLLPYAGAALPPHVAVLPAVVRRRVPRARPAAVAVGAVQAGTLRRTGGCPRHDKTRRPLPAAAGSRLSRADSTPRVSGSPAPARSRSSFRQSSSQGDCLARS